MDRRQKGKNPATQGHTAGVSLNDFSSKQEKCSFAPEHRVSGTPVALDFLTKAASRLHPKTDNPQRHQFQGAQWSAEAHFRSRNQRPDYYIGIRVFDTQLVPGGRFPLQSFGHSGKARWIEPSASNSGVPRPTPVKNSRNGFRRRSVHFVEGI